MATEKELMNLNQNKMESKLILKKTSTGFYLWRNPLDKSQELLGATVPIMNDNGVDLREYKLSLKKCQAIENGYDLDELAYTLANKEYTYEKHLKSAVSPLKIGFKQGFKEGFQKALSILGDKKFSEEDLMAFFLWADQQMKSYCGKTSVELLQEWKSLQQTEWDVEIVMERYPGLSLCAASPELDADGCIILKRK